MRIVPGTLNGLIAAIIDIPITYMILAVSFYFRFYSDLIIVSKGIPSFESYSNTFWMISLMLFFIFSLDSINEDFVSPENSWYLSRNIFIGFLIISSLAFFYSLRLFTGDLCYRLSFHITALKLVLLTEGPCNSVNSTVVFSSIT